MAQDTMHHEPADPTMDLAEHEDTYRSFVRLARYSALAFPFFFAFVLYWTQ